MEIKQLCENLAKIFIKDYDEKKNLKIFMADELRGGVERSEIVAALIFYLSKNDNFLASELIQKIKESKADIQIERGYKTNDDEYGYKGSITSAFWIIALSSYSIHLIKDEWVIKKIIDMCDDIFSYENMGFVRKSSINRNDVLNTNLLVGYAFLCASKLFITSSHREQTYNSLSKRTVAKVLKYQRFDGLFPYQTDTPRVNLIYHYMVTALLIKMNEIFQDQLINRSIQQAIKASLKTLNNDCSVNWSMQEINDKNGAMWAYSWLLGSLKETKYEVEIYNIIKSRMVDDNFPSNENDSRPDKFFSSWLLLSLTICMEKSIKLNLRVGKFYLLRYFLLDLVRLGYKFSVYYSYLLRRVKSFIFGTSLMSEKWK